MSRINLVLTTIPYQAEVFVRFKKVDGEFEPILAVVDTGAEVCLFPKTWLELAEHKVLDNDVILEQAGIAQQSFNAIEAEITLYCEDLNGNESEKLQVRAWFADTTKVIIGFQDVLDRAKLYIDFQETHTGWLDI